MFPTPVRYPRVPRWQSEQAVLDLITRWFDDYEYDEVMIEAQADFDAYPFSPEIIEAFNRIHSRQQLPMLRKKLRMGEDISPYKADLANLLDLLSDMLERERNSIELEEQPKRERGRPKKPKEKRRESSIMPDAKALCLTVIDLLKLNYPEQKVGVIKDRAIKWTAAKMRTDEITASVPGMKKMKRMTEQKLRNYMGRSRRDRRVL
jgi:hypothetical protein